MALIIPDILLHGLNIRLIRYVADILRDKFLDIHDRPEGHRFFHHPEDLFIVNVPAGEHIPAIFLLRIIDFRPGIVLLQIAAQCGNLHCLPVLDKAIFRQSAHINEKAFLPAAVTAAIENNTGDEAGSFHLILEFAGDVAGEIFSAAGIWVIFVHIRPKITVQRALGLFIGGLIEIAGACFPQQHNLKCVDHR